jgi:hypothetical protein
VVTDQRTWRRREIVDLVGGISLRAGRSFFMYRGTYDEDTVITV